MKRRGQSVKAWRCKDANKAISAMLGAALDKGFREKEKRKRKRRKERKEKKNKKKQ